MHGLLPVADTPPLKNTNQFSGWYFFACCRVFTRAGVGSCGLRRSAWLRYSPQFSLSVGQFSPFRRPLKSAKSSSTKYNTALNQWPACGLINGVRLTYWVAEGTSRVRKFAHARHFLKLCKYCLRAFPHAPESVDADRKLTSLEG